MCAQVCMILDVLLCNAQGKHVTSNLLACTGIHSPVRPDSRQTRHLARSQLNLLEHRGLSCSTSIGRLLHCGRGQRLPAHHLGTPFSGADGWRPGHSRRQASSFPLTRPEYSPRWGMNAKQRIASFVLTIAYLVWLSLAPDPAMRTAAGMPVTLRKTPTSERGWRTLARRAG